MKRLRKLLLEYQDILFPIFDVLLNGFNFFMHIYISWFISLNDYSVLNALLSFLAILFVMGISIQTFTTKELGRDKKNKHIKSKIFSSIILLLIFINSILLILTPFLMTIMRAELLSIIIVILIFDVNLCLSFIRGLMQSMQMFLKLNISFYIEVIIKLIFIVVILPIASGTSVPLFGILLGMSIASIHGLITVGKDIKVSISMFKGFRFIYKALMNIIVSNFFLYYLTSIGLIIANYYIGEKAGLYAVSLKFSQLIQAVGFSVITVLLSYSSELVTQPKLFNRYIKKWLFRFCIGGVVILGGYQLIVRHLIGLLFGEAYEGAKDFIVYQGFAYVLLTISFYIISEMIIMNQKIHIYLLSLVSLGLTIGLALNHRSIESIIIVEVISFSGLFLALLIWNIRRERING